MVHSMGQNAQVSLLCGVLKRYAYMVDSVQLKGNRLVLVINVPEDMIPTAKALISCVKSGSDGDGYA